MGVSIDMISTAQSWGRKPRLQKFITLRGRVFVAVTPDLLHKSHRSSEKRKYVESR